MTLFELWFSQGICPVVGLLVEGWDREGEREGDVRGKKYGDIHICIADSLCYKADTNTPL